MLVYSIFARAAFAPWRHRNHHIKALGVPILQWTLKGITEDQARAVNAGQ